jgi:hypothetical protein
LSTTNPTWLEMGIWLLTTWAIARSTIVFKLQWIGRGITRDQQKNVLISHAEELLRNFCRRWVSSFCRLCNTKRASSLGWLLIRLVQHWSAFSDYVLRFHQRCVPPKKEKPFTNTSQNKIELYKF